MSTIKPKYDVVILGAGHNGLVAAAYLARAGLNVLLLEKNDYIGGATASQKLFPDIRTWSVCFRTKLSAILVSIWNCAPGQQPRSPRTTATASIVVFS